MTLSDCQEDIQLIVNKEKLNNSFKDLCSLPSESAVEVVGCLKERPASSKRKQSLLGCFELDVDRIDVLNKAGQLPIVFKDNIVPDEERRLEYRYLDLRRPIMQKNLRLRSKVIHTMRSLLHDEGFVEIETPLLFKSTPEGAREFIVDRGDGTCYALPQSPQQFKQLLVIGGFDKYFQVAKCFRNEDLRSDRQPEFTQLDIEMGFAKSEDVMGVIERVVVKVFKEYLNVIPSFTIMSYDEAMSVYGSDKPDLRGDLSIETLQINKTILHERLRVPKDLVQNSLLETFANSQLEGTLEKSVYIEGSFYDFVVKRSPQAHVGMTLLGKIRLAVLDILDLPYRIDQLLWVRDFPLFYQSPDGPLLSMHHPFTAPLAEHLDLLKSDPLSVRAHHYDLVLNGVEIGGGSARIHDSRLQESIMRDYLKLPDSKIALFKHLLDALRCGAPPHAGIALGLDRILAIMTNSKSIRDVIAFPKNSAGRDLLFGTPTQMNIF